MVESAKVFEDTCLLRVRNQQGELRDAYLTTAEAEEILVSQEQGTEPPVDASQFFLFIESARIKTAFDYDPHFAVSLSGVRPLPHQLEAVYEQILPQVRLRFLLADDPGAGKTIMAGLLLKELKLRNAVEFSQIWFRTGFRTKLVTRFELATGGLQNRCSTPELHQHST